MSQFIQYNELKEPMLLAVDKIQTVRQDGTFTLIRFQDGTGVAVNHPFTKVRNALEHLHLNQMTVVFEL